MELQKEWLDKADNEGLINNPSNVDNQYVFRIAYTEGATEMLKAVEALLNKFKIRIEQTLEFMDISEKQYNILIIQKKEIEIILQELQSIKPNV
jgi:hypothetical protein